MQATSYHSMDDALEMLSAYGPDLSNMTNHAPMAADALCALGRPEAVLPWVERYRKGMVPWPPVSERIDHTNWRGALGQAPSPQRLAVFAPGFCAFATHGAIRVGHAVVQPRPIRIVAPAARAAARDALAALPRAR